MDKKERIINSAKELVLKKGYNNVSIEDITNHTGIAKGSFYTYFKNKKSLINYILKEEMLRNERERRTFFRTVKNLESAIRKLVRVSIVMKKEEDIKTELMIINFFRNIDSLDEDTAKILIDVEKNNIDFIEKILVKYVEEINVEKDEILFYAKFINGIIQNYKIFNLFVTDDKHNFITTIKELEEKYQNKYFNENLKIIIKSIIKILKQ